MKRQWPMVRLKEVLRPTVRGEPVDASKEYRLLGVRLDGHGAFLRETVTGSQTAATKLFRVAKGDFIYSRLFACRGAFGVIGESLDGCFVSGEFPTFVPMPSKIDVEFLRYWFRLPSVIAGVNEDCSGSTPLTRNRFKEQFFLALEIPLPPVSEQRRIVARIEGLAAEIAHARELRNQAAEEAEALTHSAIGTLAYQGAWETRKLSDVAEINPSRVGNVEVGANDLVSFVPMRAVDDATGTIAWPETRQFHEVSKGYTWFTNGDIIFARITPCMQNGKAALAKNLVNGVGFGSTEFHVIRPEKDVHGEWLYHLIRHKAFREDAAEYFKGTAGQQRVPQSFLEGKLVPVPPLPDQRRIVAELDALQAQVDALKRLQTETAAELDALLPAILDQAFKGEL